MNDHDHFGSWREQSSGYEHEHEPHPTAAWIQQQQAQHYSSGAQTASRVVRPQPIHATHSHSQGLHPPSESTSSRRKQSPGRVSYAEHRDQALPLPTTPSTSSQLLFPDHDNDPSPSFSRIAAQGNHEDDEALGLLIGSSSRRRRTRKNSQSSYGSSVLPAGLPLTNNRYLDPPRQYQRASSHRKHPHTSSTLPSLPVSQAPISQRPSAPEIEGWLRTSIAGEANQHQSLDSLAQGQQILPSTSFQSFAPSGRIRKVGSGLAFSEAGSTRDRQGPGSTSGLSAGIMSAGAGREDRKYRRKPSTSTREGSGYSLLEDAHPAARAAKEFGIEAVSREVDSIEQWRAKSSAVSSPPDTLSVPLSASQQQGLNQFSSVPRQRKKSAMSPDGPEAGLSQALRSQSTKSLSGKADGSVVSKSRKRSSSRAPSVAPSVTQSIFSTRTNPALADLLAISGHNSQEDTPIRRYVRWMTHEGMRAYVVPLVLLAVVFVKCSVGLAGFSGRGTPPMFGDFEAQRHWIEITTALPTSQWYFYDLQYWGLDYPPLTAWFSLACGLVARQFSALRGSFALHESRGSESAVTIAFMRGTVLFFDFVIYLPAIFLFLRRRLEGRGSRTFAIALASILLQPSLILIDNGHFQYNSVMLGFAAACFALLYTTLPNPGSKDIGQKPGSGSGIVTDLSRKLSYDYIIAAFFFCLSLSFKQMALYFAPAVFAVMLGRCIGLAQVDPERGIVLFCGLGLCVAATFGVVFSPWLTSLTQLGQLTHRIFPLARGLFEDKVSNAWCFLSVLPLPQRLKLRNLLSVPALARLSLATTLLAILPGCIMLYAAASETARREMMVDDWKMVDPAVGKERRQSVSASSIGRSARATSPEAETKRTSIVYGSQRPGSSAGAAGPSISGVLGTGTATANGNPDRPVASTLPSPAANMLLYGLASTSMAFFLFGFQTHEKSILLPLLPLTLLLGAKGDQWGGGSTAADWEWVVLAQNVASFR